MNRTVGKALRLLVQFVAVLGALEAASCQSASDPSAEAILQRSVQRMAQVKTASITFVQKFSNLEISGEGKVVLPDRAHIRRQVQGGSAWEFIAIGTTGYGRDETLQGWSVGPLPEPLLANPASWPRLFRSYQDPERLPDAPWEGGTAYHLRAHFAAEDQLQNP